MSSVWDVPTVDLGSMNRACSTVVAIIFAQQEQPQVNNDGMASKGLPTGDNLRRLLYAIDQCPLPDFVVLHFPTCKRAANFQNLPRPGCRYHAVRFGANLTIL
eukprot:1828693-Karenia_brevis.AAC.1